MEDGKNANVWQIKNANAINRVFCCLSIIVSTTFKVTYLCSEMHGYNPLAFLHFIMAADQR